MHCSVPPPYCYIYIASNPIYCMLFELSSKKSILHGLFFGIHSVVSESSTDITKLPLHDLHVMRQMCYFYFINAEETKDAYLSSLLTICVYFEGVKRWHFSEY